MYQSGGDVNSKREYTPCVGERDIWEITVPSQSCKPNYFKKTFFKKYNGMHKLLGARKVRTMKKSAEK